MIGLVDGNNFFVSCERVFNRRLVGRPVAVLSNNDGCCVSRSNEFKALGIPMGTPYFQLRDREASGELMTHGDKNHPNMWIGVPCAHVVDYVDLTIVFANMESNSGRPL